jgi:hypothetical protein
MQNYSRWQQAGLIPLLVVLAVLVVLFLGIVAAALLTLLGLPFWLPGYLFGWQPGPWVAYFGLILAWTAGLSLVGGLLAFSDIPVAENGANGYMFGGLVLGAVGFFVVPILASVINIPVTPAVLASYVAYFGAAGALIGFIWVLIGDYQSNRHYQASNPV